MPISLHGCGSHDEWVNALRHALDAGDTANEECPCCRQRELQLRVAVASSASGRGTIYFWCDRCLSGLIPNAGPVDHSSSFVDKAEFDPPDYRVVHP